MRYLYVGYCCNVTTYKWKVHYGKIEYLFRWEKRITVGTHRNSELLSHVYVCYGKLSNYVHVHDTCIFDTECRLQHQINIQSHQGIWRTYIHLHLRNCLRNCVANFFLVFCGAFTFWVPFCDVRHYFRIKTRSGLSLPLVFCTMAHVLFTLFVFPCI